MISARQDYSLINGFSMREPKAKAPWAPRKPAPPVVRTDADVAAILPPTFGQMRPLPPEAEAFAIFAPSARPRPVAKPEPAAESPAYLAWVRLGECCNPGCHEGPPCDPHHEGAKIVSRGVSLKVADHFTVSLCRRCHRVITGIPGHVSGCLPDTEASKHERTLILRSREESLAILRRALDERLSRALALLPRELRIELISKALAKVPEAVLRAALLGEGSNAGR